MHVPDPHLPPTLLPSVVAPDTAPASDTEPKSVADPGGLPAIPGYEITGEIARGGMGRVLAGRELALDREVAIKTLLPKANPARFVTESKITAKLPHPNIPPVHALGTLADGSPFLAMKLIRGWTLAAELGDRESPRVELSRFVQIFEQVAQAVGFAHSRGVVHRDLKPLNVMVGEFGEVQVMDWGLARELAPLSPGGRGVGGEGDSSGPAPEGSVAHTRAGSVMGTPAYMAPEQARGEPADERADVFALGVTLMEILTGERPWGDGLPEVVTARAARALLTDCHETLAACPADAELVAVARKCLSADPAGRYPDGRAVADAVAAYRAGVDARLRQAETERAEAVVREAEQRKRRKVQLLLAFSILVLLSGAGAFAWWQNQQANRQARDEALLKQEQDFKAEQARQGIAASLALAVDLRNKYKFKEAAAALAQAAKLAEGAPERLPQITQAQDDLAFAVELDDIRYRKAIWIPDEGGKGSFNTRIAAPEYRKVFAARRLDLAILSPAEAAGRIAASGVKAELVAAVDDWALHEPNGTLRDRLLAIARRADPGPWTDRLRDPAIRGSKSEVDTLAAAAKPAELVPAALGVLSELMERRDLDPSALLTSARGEYPDEFDLAFALGRWHDGRKDGRQIGPYEAARALRPDNVAVWINLGNALRGKKDVDGAIAAFKKATELAPRFASAFNNLGNALDDKKDVDGAIVAYRKAIELDHNHARAYTNLGTALRTKKDMDGAIVAYRKAIELDPTLPDAHAGLGNALRDKRDVDGAIAAYRKAIELDPNRAISHTNLGSALDDKRDADGAVTAHRKAIELDPLLASAHFGLGNALRAKDVDGAIAAYRKAIELDPNSAKVHTNLGVALRAKKEGLDAAIAAHRKAVELDPNDANAFYNLGIALHDKRDVDGAIAAYRKAIELDPKEANAHTGLGNALRAKKEGLDAAIAAHRKAVELDPNDANAFYNLGIALHDKRDVDGAIAAYRKAIELDPNNAATHTNLGVVYGQQKKYRESAAEARAAILLDPEAADAHALLGLSLQNLGEKDAARQAMREAVRLNPTKWEPKLAEFLVESKAVPPKVIDRKDPNALVAEGTRLRGAGQFQEAAKLYREALAIDPKNARIHNFLGLALHSDRDFAGAEKSYREATRLDPNFAIAHSNLAIALRLQKKHADAIPPAREAIRLNPKIAAAHQCLGLSLQATGDPEGAKVALAEAARLDPKQYGKPPPARELAPPPRPVK